MKILLCALNSKYIHSNLAVRYLKKNMGDVDCECKIKEFTINERIENILESIIFENPDIVGFSCYIWNIEYVTKLSKLIKLVNKKIEILYGGPEVSFECENFLKNNVGDYLIKGEGEETFREFIKIKVQDADLSTNPIKGLYFKINDRISFGGERELIDLNQLIFPYDEDENLDNKIVYYEASRGCPFFCKYCLSSTIHGVRLLDIERVKKELDFFIKKKVKLIKFVDRTFNCKINYAKEIWEYLMECDTDATFHFELSVDLLTDEVIDLLSNAPKGRFQFECGVQTTNEEVLRNVNRYSKYEEIKNNIIRLKNKNNIKLHLDLIAGLPKEDFSSFRNSFNDVYSLKPEEIQLGFLKILKGSQMKEESEKWGLVSSPYPPYEILKTDAIDYKELEILKRIESVFDKYYNSGKFTTILNYFEKCFDDAFTFYYRLGKYFYDNGYFKNTLSSVDYYKALVDFNHDVVGKNNELLNELVKFDYLRFNRRKWIPQFILRDVDKNIENKVRNYIKCDQKYAKIASYHIEKFRYDCISMLINSQIIERETLILFDDVSFNVYNEISKFD